MELFDGGFGDKEVAMKIRVIFLVFAVAILGFGSGVCAEKAWSTQKELKTPESIRYDDVRDVIYVSSINGRATEKDGNGFISKLTTGGKIENLKWITGLDAPKGMDFGGGKLFVSDIDHLVEIDIEKGEVSARYQAEGAQFLNDVAVDDSGTVYVSDASKVSVIYALNDGEIAVWLDSEEIVRPNGLFYHDGKLYVGSTGDGALKVVDIATKKVKTVADVGFGIDGLVLDGDGGFIVSDWRGKTSSVSRDGKVKTLIDTSEAGINSADIEYIIELDLLLVPTFMDDRVMAYHLKESEE